MLVTFVCQGNICRSPMAEFIFKDLLVKHHLDNKINVSSAGFSENTAGWPIHAKTAEQLKLHNVTHNSFVSKQLNEKLFIDSDYIIVMDNKNLSKTLAKFGKFNIPNKIYKITSFAPELGVDIVDDPYYTGDFVTTYKLISTACPKLLEDIKSKHQIN